MKKSNGLSDLNYTLSTEDVAWHQWFSSANPTFNQFQKLRNETPLWRGWDGNGPLVWSLRQSPYPWRHLKIFIESKADLNEADAPLSPLSEACYRREKKCIEHLIKNGADLNPVNQEVPLASACKQANQSSDLLFDLLKNGASIKPAKNFTGLISELDRAINEHLWSESNRGFWDKVVKILIKNPSEWIEFKVQWESYLNEFDFHSSPVPPIMAWLAQWEKQELSVEPKMLGNPSFSCSPRRL